MELNKTCAIVCFYLLHFVVLDLLAQPDSSAFQNPVFINSNFLSGHIIRHDKNIAHTTRNYVRGISLTVNDLLLLKTKQNDRLQKYYVDLGFLCIDNGYDFLGNNIGLTIGKTQRFIQYKKLSLYGIWNIGIGLNTNPYSKKNNKNLGVASSFSFLNRVELHLTYPIYERWYALAAIGMNHMSNGAIREPNLGFNIMTSEFGVSYLLRSNKDFREVENKPLPKKYYFHLMEGCVITNNDSWSDDRYTILILHSQFERILSLRHSFIISLDYSYDRRIPYNKSKKDYSKNNDYNYLGISTGFNWKLANVELICTSGIDFISPWYNSHKWYTLFYTKYFIADRFFMFVGMKAQRFNAAYLAGGIGLKIF